MMTKSIYLSCFIVIIVTSGINQCYPQETDYDKYGGFKKISREAAGYFTLGKFNEKHFLFTPEGNAYIAIGLNHFHTTKNTDYDAMISDLKSWGFNAGCYQGPRWMWNRFPYTKGINLLEIRSYVSEDKFGFQDVFSDGFLIDLEKRIKSIVQPQAENKMLIGYFLTDMPVWTKEKYGQTWISFFKTLDTNSPGGKTWKAWKAFNTDTDEQEFLGIIAHQLYSKGTALIKKYDPNHLIFSERFNESDLSDIVVGEALPFVDAIATQPAPKLNMAYFEKLYKNYKKPIYIADHVSSFAHHKHKKTMGQVAHNEASYFEFYENYVSSVLALPYIIGYKKCQYENEPRPGLLKQGLVNQSGKPYDYVSKLNEVHSKALLNAYKTN